MTKSEFAEIVEWVHAQWPNSAPWPPATIETTFGLVAHLEVDDMRSGVLAFHSSGSKWKPEPAEIVKAAKEAARERLQYRSKHHALPDDTELLSLGEWLEKHGFESFQEAVTATEAL